MAGVWATRRAAGQAARTLGAGEWPIFRHVVFPSALPMIFTGARIALAAAFSTVVAAELMARQGRAGLDDLLGQPEPEERRDHHRHRHAGHLGMALGWLMLALDRRLVHWRGLG